MGRCLVECGESWSGEGTVVEQRGLRGGSRQVPEVAGAARSRARSARGSGVGIEEHVENNSPT